MAKVRVVTTSTEYVAIEVDAVDAVGNPADLASLPVAINFKSMFADAPAQDDSGWRNGDWITRPKGGTARYLARVLIGPDSPDGALAAGEYKAYVRISSDPETPIKTASDTLVVLV